MGECWGTLGHGTVLGTARCDKGGQDSVRECQDTPREHRTALGNLEGAQDSIGGLWDTGQFWGPHDMTKDDDRTLLGDPRPP